MTTAEKKERRAIRKELMGVVRKHHFTRDFKLSSTNSQWKAAARKVADQLLAGKNPLTVVIHEA